MKDKIVATLKGAMNTSLNILLGTMLQVGDTIDMNNITHLVPDGENTTHFFKNYVNFCESNGKSRIYRVDEISQYDGRYVLQVSGVRA